VEEVGGFSDQKLLHRFGPHLKSERAAYSAWGRNASRISGRQFYF